MPIEVPIYFYLIHVYYDYFTVQKYTKNIKLPSTNLVMLTDLVKKLKISPIQRQGMRRIERQNR